MTRPLTKRELALAARPLMTAGIDHQTPRQASISQFVIINACRGIALGITFAVFLLMTGAAALDLNPWESSQLFQDRPQGTVSLAEYV